MNDLPKAANIKSDGDGGWTSGMLKQIDEEATQQQFIPEPSKPTPPVSYDPSPSAEAVTKERMTHLLASVTTTTLDQLRELRDEIDNLMRVVQARHDTILDACHEHVNYSTSTISCKEIIKSNLSKITDDFKNGTDPVSKTITVTENKVDRQQ